MDNWFRKHEEHIIITVVSAIYIALFATMIVAATVHNWFAFSGYLIAWLLATCIGFAIKEM